MKQGILNSIQQISNKKTVTTVEKRAWKLNDDFSLQETITNGRLTNEYISYKNDKNQYLYCNRKALEKLYKNKLIHEVKPKHYYKFIYKDLITHFKKNKFDPKNVLSFHHSFGFRNPLEVAPLNRLFLLHEHYMRERISMDPNYWALKKYFKKNKYTKKIVEKDHQIDGKQLFVTLKFSDKDWIKFWKSYEAAGCWLYKILMGQTDFKGINLAKFEKVYSSSNDFSD